MLHKRITYSRFTNFNPYSAKNDQSIAYEIIIMLNKKVPTPNLEQYTSANFSRGRAAVIEVAWIFISMLLVTSFVPGVRHRIFLLRFFGARLGKGVVVKPGVKVKFPWRLTVGDHSWIGEGAWIDNLASVTIGANACISQGAYLCTGNHDWSATTFNLKTESILLQDGSWVAARAVVGPGVTVGHNAVVALGAVATRDIPPGRILFASGKLAERSRTIEEGV
ncbi:MAG: WcaF family extracellular polysaccharide biosynthesis acetyltransferase [Pseudomonadota bacterium]